MSDTFDNKAGGGGQQLFGPSQFDLSALMGTGTGQSTDLNALASAGGEMGSGGSNSTATPATGATPTTATPTAGEGDFSALAPASPGGPSTQSQFAYNLGLSTGPNPSSPGELAKTSAATTGVAK